MTSFKREVYHVGGADIASYELTDAYGHCCQLDPQQAMDLLTWLSNLRGQIRRDLHPESAPTFAQQVKPDASTQIRASWIDDLEI